MPDTNARWLDDAERNALCELLNRIQRASGKWNASLSAQHMKPDAQIVTEFLDGEGWLYYNDDEDSLTLGKAILMAIGRQQSGAVADAERVYECGRYFRDDCSGFDTALFDISEHHAEAEIPAPAAGP